MTHRHLVTTLALAVAVLTPGLARAHCDTLDGPVVGTARTALESGRLGPVLAWVRADDEQEIRAAFKKALAARKAGPAAREVADTWFFETLVRVHRAGEGAPYTGLRPAGLDAGPAVPAADRAVQTGDLAPVERLLAGELQAGLRQRFARLRAEKTPGEDVAAGRAWVAAYVPFVHYVEGVHRATQAGAEHAAGGEHGSHAASTPDEQRAAEPAAAHRH